MTWRPREPETIVFQDDGVFPNSRLPLLCYRSTIESQTPDLAAVFERRLAVHGWTGAWQGGVYAFPHYHSTAHEVLAVFRGEATLQLGGPTHGRALDVKSGDVIVLPAGVAHECMDATADFAVVGAYPDAQRWDLLRGHPGERPAADRNIAAVPLPQHDPLYGKKGPLRHAWHAPRQH